MPLVPSRSDKELTSYDVNSYRTALRHAVFILIASLCEAISIKIRVYAWLFTFFVQSTKKVNNPRSSASRNKEEIGQSPISYFTAYGLSALRVLLYHSQKVNYFHK